MKSLSILFFLAIFSSLTLAQSEKSSNESAVASVEWKTYRIPNSRVSFGMPKMPVVENSGYMMNVCRRITGQSYHSYAGETVYSLSWTGGYDGPVPPHCWPDDDKRPLDINDYSERVSNSHTERAIESDIALNSFRGKVFTIESDAFVETKRIFWIDERIVELTTVRRKNVSTDGEKQFLTKLGLDSASAQETGQGSIITLGDPTSSPPTVSPEAVTEPLVIRSKGRPGYTEEARAKGTSGSVVLRVTFLANGSIGELTTIKGLENGLTEKTIAAARRITFLPARANGVSVTVSKQVEYSFSVY